MRNRIEDRDFKEIEKQLGIPHAEVKKIVHSFFGSLESKARKLPFNTERKIYSSEGFSEYGYVQNVPFIGRIGTSFSRYLTWRGNESKEQKQVERGRCSDGYTPDEIEAIAREALSGKTPMLVKKHKAREFYTKIWIVGKGRKRLARQAILKDKEDVQD